MKKLIVLFAMLIALPVAAQTYGTEEVAIRTYDSASAAMSASASQTYPLGMIPVSLSFTYPYAFRITSYTTIQQLSNYEYASCSVTTGNGGDPLLFVGSIGCHLRQDGWSVATRATASEVQTFFSALTSREQKTFAYFRAPGSLVSENSRFVMNWQPEFEVCISGPI